MSMLLSSGRRHRELLAVAKRDKKGIARARRANDRLWLI